MDINQLAHLESFGIWPCEKSNGQDQAPAFIKKPLGAIEASPISALKFRVCSIEPVE